MRTLDHGSTAAALGAMLTAVSAFGAEIAVLPVRASGVPPAIVQNQLLTNTPGARISLEIHLRNWDPEQTGLIELKLWSVAFDRMGFQTGALAFVDFADQSCSTNADCAAALGTGSQCGPLPLPSDLCTAGFQDTSRPDWIYSCCPSASAVNLDPPFVTFGSIALDQSGAVDTGESVYVGTLVLDAHPHARGTFIIAPIGNPDATFMVDSLNRPIPIDRVLPAFLILAPPDACCRSDGTCFNTAATNCATLGRTPILGTRCLTDLDGDEMDDACTGDCNENRVWDPVDLELGQSPDCNENGVPDECDQNSGVGTDCNKNGVLDDCEQVPRGDLTGDGAIRVDDVRVFGECATSPCAPPGCAADIFSAPCCFTGDSDRDGDLDLSDFARFQRHFQGQPE